MDLKTQFLDPTMLQKRSEKMCIDMCIEMQFSWNILSFRYTNLIFGTHNRENSLYSPVTTIMCSASETFLNYT